MAMRKGTVWWRNTSILFSPGNIGGHLHLFSSHCHGIYDVFAMFVLLSFRAIL